MILPKKSTKINWSFILILALLILTLESCRPGSAQHAKFNNAVEVFFISVTMIVNIVIFGSLALIFSILGSTHIKHGMRVAGSILTGVFGLFALMGLGGLSTHTVSNPLVFMIMFITVLIFGLGVYFSSKKRIPKSPELIQKTGKNIPTLDEIINEEDEIV